MVGQYFTTTKTGSPSKTKCEEKATSHTVIYLAKLSLKYVKEAVVRAEEFIYGGDLPAGKTWDDLYTHVVLKHEEEIPANKYVTGFMLFVCLTKHNDGGGDCRQS